MFATRALAPVSRPTFVLQAAALAAVLALTACGGSGGDSSSYVVPSAPTGLGTVDTAPVPSVALDYADYGATNVRDACHATVDTNAGVRLFQRYLDLWTPVVSLVDGGSYAACTDSATGISYPAVDQYYYTGTDGTVLDADVHLGNIQYSIAITNTRTDSQALAAYYDDRRQKGYSITDGLGPLTSLYRTAAAQTTSIVAVNPNDSTVAAASDSGNNLGSTSSDLGTVVTFVGSTVTSGNFASAEPTKAFYKYARPWRWSPSVVVVPALISAKSSTAYTDGGFPSGHTAEGVRDALAMAYVLPERFQELVARAQELGQNRIVAGMHSRLDVMGGRMLGIAAAVYGLTNNTTATTRQAAYDQAHSVLMAAAGVGNEADFYAYAQAGTSANDRFTDKAAMKATALGRIAYGFSPIGVTTTAAVVPKNAEILLETRLPYLTADQRRVVLKTTAVASGYPLLDDDEGYGRLNLVAAADGYGAFNGDVDVTMDASLAGFNALDRWKNDISGAGKLTKEGSGTLALTGANTYSGGTVVSGGTLRADSASALGAGAVYVDGGTLATNVDSGTVQVQGPYTQKSGGLSVTMGGSSAGQLAVAGDAALAGALTVSFGAGYTPAVGDTITVLTAKGVHGSFGTVNLPTGVAGSLTYNSGSVVLKITAI